MGKTGLSGIRKKKPIKGKKKFLTKIAQYLTYDSYMFAPLLTSSIKEMGSAPRGIEVKEQTEGNGKRLFGKFGEYLKSDSYMYALLVPKQTSCSPEGVEPMKENEKSLEKVSGYLNSDSHMYAPVVVQKEITSAPKGLQPTDLSAQVSGEDRPHKGRIPETRPAAKQTLVQRETVKHMVYQFCHSSSMSGKRMNESQLRKLVVE